jgi:LysM repeat protein
MNYLVILVCSVSLFICSLQTARAESHPLPDSVGVETANGKTFVLHKVDAGQTLYAVMRRYQTSINAIKQANPGMSEHLRTGEVIRIPYTASRPAKVAAREERKKKEEKQPESTPVITGGLHTVEAGQTLYSIAVKYGVLMADVRKWNGLSSDNVQAGQELIVTEKAYLDRNPAPVASPRPAEREAAATPTPVVEKPRRPTYEAPTPPAAPTGKRMSESGLAEIIDTEESSSKYLALHHSVPVGTLVQVKNEYNQETIWVKVVGKIPDTSVNEDIVIKLSARAFEKLSPNSRRFRAEISYISAN